MSKPRRAEPLSPDDRRSAVAKAVLPILVERGAAVTTRELAQAAGVAEGTLFSVFDTKRDILTQAIEQHLNPEPITNGLAGIPANQSLHTQLTEAASIITSSSQDAVTLLGILKTLPPDEGEAKHRHHSFMRGWLAAVSDAAQALFERNAAQLATSPGRATAAFVALLMAANRSYGNENTHLPASDAVELLLGGIVKKGSADAG